MPPVSSEVRRGRADRPLPLHGKTQDDTVSILQRRDSGPKRWFVRGRMGVRVVWGESRAAAQGAGEVLQAGMPMWRCVRYGVEE